MLLLVAVAMSHHAGSDRLAIAVVAVPMPGMIVIETAGGSGRVAPHVHVCNRAYIPSCCSVALHLSFGRVVTVCVWAC